MKNEKDNALQGRVKTDYYYNVPIYSSLEVVDWSFPEGANKPIINVKYSDYKPYHRNIAYDPIDVEGLKNQQEIDEYRDLLTLQEQLEQDFSFILKDVRVVVRAPIKRKVELALLCLYIPISFKDSAEKLHKLLIGRDQIRADNILTKVYVKKVGRYSSEAMSFFHILLEDENDNLDDASKDLIIRLMLFAEKLAIDMFNEYDPEMLLSHSNYFEKTLDLLKKYNKESLANNYPPGLLKENKNEFSIEKLKGMFFSAVSSFTNSCGKVFVSSEEGTIEEKESLKVPLQQDEMRRDNVSSSGLRRRNNNSTPHT